MKKKIRKVLFNKLQELSPNKVLLWPDFQLAFEVKTGESLNDNFATVNEVMDELEKADYARLVRSQNRLPTITKGINFDEWEREMNPNNSGSYLNIGALNAQNMQVGNENIMNVNITPEEFIEALEKMQKKPEKASSVLSQLNFLAKQGLSVGQTIAEFIRLMS
ncbi:MAG: hypothetical protein FXF54_04780 [Kosmotoga sp.]|nr:MAG: hypothetical protein FXF54_04780 [Kosmotoga sp.]